MLDPKYLEQFSDQLLGIIDSLTIAIISDMAKRIVKMGNVSESTKHQALVSASFFLILILTLSGLVPDFVALVFAFSISGGV